jgi:hypothetical protein
MQIINVLKGKKGETMVRVVRLYNENGEHYRLRNNEHYTKTNSKVYVKRSFSFI